MRALAHLSIALLLPAALASAQEPAGGPLTPGKDGVTRPQLLSETLPAYPFRAERERIGALVRMAFVVDAAGDVRDVAMLEFRPESGDTAASARDGLGDATGLEVARDFEKAARRALMARHYAPAMRKGKPVPVRMEVTFEFSSEERQALARWLQVEEGLRALADDSIIQPGDAVAGQDGVSVPVAVKQVAPIQPHGARVRGLRSRVTLLAMIGEDGRVLDIPLVRAEQVDQPFGDAAAAALRRWRFRPAERDGAAVAAWHWVRMSVPFESGSATP